VSVVTALVRGNLIRPLPYKRPMQLEAHFDRWHHAARSDRRLQWFAWFNRVALAVAFLPSGLTKILGNRFTILGLDNPVGFFFEAMYRTGIYWRFIGAAQLLAALLILLPRTHALGALLYFTIAVNIFLITVGIGFQGTWVITGMMVLASLYLVCWHYDAWKRVLFSQQPRTSATV
jgi:uncharacterized membrane protein YphA (DoxX/SURF4 family)